LTQLVDTANNLRMRKLLITFVPVLTVFTLLSTQASALGSWCQFSYRSESFSLGLHEAFEKEKAHSKYKVLEQICYRMGKTDGLRRFQAGKSSGGETVCMNAYYRAKGEGFGGANQVLHSPTECSQAGYLVGKSMMVMSARAGDHIGTACVRAYNRGEKHGINNRIRENLNSEVEQNCYNAGFEDGTLFRGQYL